MLVLPSHGVLALPLDTAVDQPQSAGPIAGLAGAAQHHVLGKVMKLLDFPVRLRQAGDHGYPQAGCIEHRNAEAFNE